MKKFENVSNKIAAVGIGAATIAISLGVDKVIDSMIPRKHPFINSFTRAFTMSAIEVIGFNTAFTVWNTDTVISKFQETVRQDLNEMKDAVVATYDEEEYQKYVNNCMLNLDSYPLEKLRDGMSDAIKTVMLSPFHKYDEIGNKVRSALYDFCHVYAKEKFAGELCEDDIADRIKKADLMFIIREYLEDRYDEKEIDLDKIKTLIDYGQE